MRSAERIRRAADRAASLTRRMLAFSRQEPMRRALVDLNEVVRETQELFSHSLPRRIGLKSDLEPGPLPVQGDEGQLGQIVMNLVMNAVDAMSEGGDLYISTRRREGGRIALVVRDSGEGIPADRVEKIFEPFYTTKPRGRGTGLGLATVRAIVLEHAGSIEVESQIGIGTKMTIILPEAEGTVRTVERSYTQDRAEPPTQTIFLLDVDELTCNLLSEVLCEAGYRVIVADGPEDALGRPSEFAMDLLITSYERRAMIGEVLARHGCDELQDMAVLYLTELGDRSSTTVDADGSEVNVLCKPFGIRTLLDRVREAIDRPRANESS
jgi:two-component sensor histidine kinase/CheY-like chemotaxis protein